MGQIAETMTALADAIRARSGYTGKMNCEQLLWRLSSAVNMDKEFIERTIESIQIPDSITEIGDFAFCECTSLSSVTIPDSVTSIAYGAFRDCTSLSSITIPSSVTNIVSGAFENCTIHFRFRCSESEVPEGYPWESKSATAEYNYTGDE